ncbi:UDP-glucuronosyltransferase 1A3-like isoform X4 [Hemitrygon akajei]|uniref:UDP-glucuronosyltransferase 1A3-like isoform X4 n=1 Tax=Hemitrygon akajei TaxID=2704970 RepID=UPI003BF9FB47
MAWIYRDIGQLVWFLLCLQWSCIWVESGKLLVVPFDGSHWLSLQTILKELHGRGHQIVVIYPENTLMIKASHLYTSKTYFIPFSKEDVVKTHRDLIQMAFYNGTIYERVRSTLEHLDLEDFLNSSGEHGVVIFSLGSLISDMPISTANMIAEALGQIPQKVVWRYSGERPSKLAPNTKLLEWLPQNDLLAHPKTRAFLTHGGTHGIYEAICAAVPMVIIPLFGDQQDNMLQMIHQGAGIGLSLQNMNSQDLVEALTHVINDTKYKETMMKLSSLHQDRLFNPLELSVYWVEFVMRHRSAKHLQTAAHDLNWIQFYCLDVIGTFLAVTLLFVYLVIKCCLVCLRKVKGHRKNKLD